LNCRGNRGEAAAYAASLALWQKRMVEQADAIVVPSVFARERLRILGAPLPWERVNVLAPPIRALAGAETESLAPGGAARRGGYALVVSRLAPEKGVDVAIEACRLAGVPLVIAGDGPEREALAALARSDEGHDGGVARPVVRFVGHVEDVELAQLRAGAALALAPSRSAETFGLAAAEAMAAGLPVLASRVGALEELVEDAALVSPGDPQGLAAAIARLAGDSAAGERARERVRAVCAPELVARGLVRIYDGSA
jgi:glycosyltransferase involved in cell wall biosynthesis